jgi:hypothetical protein
VLIIRTILGLGLLNILYMAWYKLSLRFRIRRIFFPIKHHETGVEYYLSEKSLCESDEGKHSPTVKEADELLSGKVRLFSANLTDVGNPPIWMKNPLNGQLFPNADDHWTQLPDFDSDFGDIKNIWELSRFAWATTLARAFCETGNPEYIATLNRWVSDWLKKNPLNQGPNWKCGQEASIRVFNLMNASLIMGAFRKPQLSLARIIDSHLERISSNIRYGVAQDNNHGTSEAAALFMGGNWLAAIYPDLFPKANHFADLGRKWLENRVSKLIQSDGAFSQHSMNYHRVLLDTIIYTELWRKVLELDSFSDKFYSRIKSAIEWLEIFTDPLSGDVPNFGANDGALLLNLHSCDYRDFRPTIQTAHVLFNKGKLYPAGGWDEPLRWLHLESASMMVRKDFQRSKNLKSGYVYIRGDSSWAMVRYPHFKFRPAHNDIFHFDLWYKGQNIIFDSGTFSYNQSDQAEKIDLKSVHFHNTVSFNGEEQMPEISRFLLGDWLKPDYVSAINAIDGIQIWSSQYTSRKGFRHQRTISCQGNIWLVEDNLSGKYKAATIGFNIYLNEYNIEANVIKTSWGVITMPQNRTYRIVESYASRYYQEKAKVLRLEINVNETGRFTTRFDLK